VLGRTAVGVLLPPGLDRRRVGAANFALQMVGSLVLMGAGESAPALLLGTVLFGLGLGNLLSLPPLIAQAEWPPGEVAGVLALLTAVNQAFYAFGPAIFGAALQGWGDGAPPALAAGLQVAAGLILVVGRSGRGR
jgi:predicted MFS family arabinose efflux permease